ncbi:T9SS type A sorting domain-containing protein [candidate division WOR-3 bacterium]|nr:T9SS type A sorting domain-containing protein [candidate division WOR-3 bacterium]MCK4527163.1 T9SS type A sorting domain-containing protein [candidate division WOR-3 bacterium]
MRKCMILCIFLLSLAVYPTLAYIAGGYFYIYDVSNPDSVEQLSETIVTNGWCYPSCYDVWVKGDYAYLAVTTDNINICEYGGIYVFDVSDSTDPYYVADCTWGTDGDGYNIFIQGSLAYLVTKDVIWFDPPHEADGGLYIYDISDPLNPTLQDSMTLPGNPRDVFVDSQYVYVGTEDSLFILTFPPQGVEEKEIEETVNIKVEYQRVVIEFMSSQSGELDVSLFDILGRELRNIKRNILVGYNLIAMDISDIGNGVYFLPVSIDGKTYRNKFIKIGHTGEVRSAEIRRKTKGDLQRISSIGVKARNIYAIPDYVFITPDSSSGVRSIGVSDPYNPIKCGWAGNIVHGLGVKDTLLFAFDGFNLRVANISDPANPVRIDTLEIKSSKEGGGDVQIRGNKAYTVAGPLDIFDISNPLYPMLIYESVPIGARSVYIK